MANPSLLLELFEMKPGMRLTTTVGTVEPMAGGSDMTTGSRSSVYLTELNQMIGRAENACERYRQAAAERGLSPPLIARRVMALQRMEEALARLRVQRHEKPRLVVPLA